MRCDENSPEAVELRKDISDFIKAGGGFEKKEKNDMFNRLCLRLFKLQYESMESYSKFCDKKGANPSNVKDFLDIPPIPAQVFKSSKIFIYPDEKIYLTFKTSGTSGAARAEAYYSKSGAELTSLAVVTNARMYFFPDGKHARFFLFAPRPDEAPNLTMSFGFTEVINKIGPYGGSHYIGKTGLKIDEFFSAIKKTVDENIPAAILAPSFALVAILDKMNADKIKFKLPSASRVLDAGGFKGRSREIDRGQMLRMVEENFGVAPEYCVNALGMSEIGSQYYDNNLKNYTLGIKSAIVKENPHWAKTLVMKTDGSYKYIAPSSYEEMGALVHFDLSNFDRALAVLSDDKGSYAPGGFLIHGRLVADDLKGCSLTAEELINKVN